VLLLLLCQADQGLFDGRDHGGDGGLVVPEIGQAIHGLEDHCVGGWRRLRRWLGRHHWWLRSSRRWRCRDGWWCHHRRQQRLYRLYLLLLLRHGIRDDTLRDELCDESDACIVHLPRKSSSGVGLRLTQQRINGLQLRSRGGRGWKGHWRELAHIGGQRRNDRRCGVLWRRDSESFVGRVCLLLAQCIEPWRRDHVGRELTQVNEGVGWSHAALSPAWFVDGGLHAIGIRRRVVGVRLIFTDDGDRGLDGAGRSRFRPWGTGLRPLLARAAGVGGDGVMRARGAAVVIVDLVAANRRRG